MNLKINGNTRQFDGDPQMPLLWYLRDMVDLTGTKYGCGAGLCGACTVHVNGEAVRSCVTPVQSVEGKAITTIEGISPDGSHPVQQAWKTLNVPQCGYCQSGMIMKACELLSKNAQPSEQQIDDTINTHICRCGTYQRICDAVKLAAKGGK
jgi:isoquinoline 1-oxidoreductase subunit alpha